MGLYSTKCCGVSNDSSDPHSLNKTIPPWFRGFIGVCVYLEKDKTSAQGLPHSSGRGYPSAVGRKEVNLSWKEKVPHFLTQLCHWDTEFTQELC